VNMRNAGGLVALIGGIFGVIAALVTILIGGAGAVFEVSNANTVIGLGFGGILFSFLTIILGAVAMKVKSKTTGTLIIVSAILGMILGGTFVAIFMILPLIGGILVVTEAKKEDKLNLEAGVISQKKVYQKGWFWMVIVIISIVIIAISEGSIEPVKSVGAQIEPVKISKVEKGVKIYKIGDAVKWRNYIFKVNSVRKDLGGGFLKPKKGYIYYIVDVTVENKSNESFAVSSLLMFKLVDSEGYSYNVTFGPDTKGQLDGDIRPGRKLRGELAFEIPNKAKGLELEIKPSVWGSEKIIFKLDR